ncbi:hypothetical protein [Streptomyces sp. NPDC002057]|uniref:hypothetical protein n=1 Tax=Streptomyces sp. NPDC002057 TaxID=3154664 RepID=UPI0033286FBF
MDDDDHGDVSNDGDAYGRDAYGDGDAYDRDAYGDGDVYDRDGYGDCDGDVTECTRRSGTGKPHPA